MTKNVCNELKVSYYRNIASNPLILNYIRFVNSVKKQQFENQISEIRESLDKDTRRKLKRKLPSICPAALIAGTRRNQKIVKPTGIISVDIDNIPGPEILKNHITRNDFVFSAFISPSQFGLKVLFRIPADEETFLHSYLSIEEYFKRNYNIEIDKACKDITRLMFVSSDSDIYYNPESKIYTGKIKPKIPKSSLVTPSQSLAHTNNVELLIANIELHRIDITAHYFDWLKISYALISAFGNNGLNYFLKISQFHPGFDRMKAAKQFNNCLRTGSRSVSISSLFSIAKDYGISFKH